MPVHGVGPYGGPFIEGGARAVPLAGPDRSFFSGRTVGPRCPNRDAAGMTTAPFRCPIPTEGERGKTENAQARGSAGPLARLQLRAPALLSGRMRAFRAAGANSFP